MIVKCSQTGGRRQGSGREISSEGAGRGCAAWNCSGWRRRARLPVRRSVGVPGEGRCWGGDGGGHRDSRGAEAALGSCHWPFTICHWADSCADTNAPTHQRTSALTHPSTAARGDQESSTGQPRWWARARSGWPGLATTVLCRVRCSAWLDVAVMQSGLCGILCRTSHTCTGNHSRKGSR
jgi:hypothetical protein